MNLKNFLLSFGLLSMTTTATTTAIGCSCGAPRDTTDDQIVNFINTYDYESEIIKDSKYEDAVKQIIPDFVKFELSTVLRNKFKDNSFRLDKITGEDGETELNDNSFSEIGSIIQAKFFYDYGKFKGQVASLKFPVINSDEKKVIDEINKAEYIIDNFEINSTYDDLKNRILTDDNGDFIKNGIDDADIREKFNSTYFELNNLTDDNWTELTNDNFKQFGLMVVKTNYRYHYVEQETTFLHLKVIARDEANIVSGINGVTDYETHLPIGSKYDDLVFNISGEFIQEKLSAELQANFSESALKINEITNNASGEKIEDADLENLQKINAKINYDYGTTKNQNTNLLINVEKKNLSVELKVFQLRDRKNIVGFLDGNSLSMISKEIEDYLSIPSFVDAGLYFDEQTSTSVVVKALETSEKYTGEIKLTWKLKLFEIWGIGIGGQSDKDLGDGLKGYFYLENDEDQGVILKYFDTFGYLTGKAAPIHSYLPIYHKLSFNKDNTVLKSFTFNGNWVTSDVGKNFESLDFTFNKITIASPEPRRIKIFDLNTEKWVETTNKTYSINELGIIK